MSANEPMTDERLEFLRRFGVQGGHTVELLSELDRLRLSLASETAQVAGLKAECTRYRDAAVELELEVVRERERLAALVGELRGIETGLGDYFRFHGAEHEDDECPQDDGCECPLVCGVNKAFADLIRVQRHLSEFVRATASAPDAARRGEET